MYEKNAAALYIRLSKEDDNGGESESIANQRSLLREYCKKHQIYVYDEYIDDGWSGGNFDRPGFKRMIADIESKHVNTVITKDLSRFGRDYILTGHYMERWFPEHGVRYISLLDGIDTGQELSANDITPFRAIINDLYARDISKKIKSVKRDKQQKGLFIGWKPPYGYKTATGNVNKLVMDDEAAAVIREIFDMALAGVSCRQIAAELNNRGVKSPAVYANLQTSKKGAFSGQWTQVRISEILKNRVYVGDMVQRRMEKVSYKSNACRRLPEDQWVIVENTHSPIVGRDEQERVVRLINSRKKTRRRVHDHPFKGIIFCMECKKPLAVICRKLSGNKEALYFVCRTYQQFTKSTCTSHCIRVDTVTNAVAERVRTFAKYKNNQTDPQAEIKRLTSEVRNLTSKMDMIYNDRLTGVIENPDFTRMYNNFKENRNTSQKRLNALKNTAEQELSIKKFNFLESAEVTRELVCSLIERIELSDDKKILICFRFAPTEIAYLQ
ncbi:MAG: recombinase family protein [Defluviitaleaceae bacterium]|nr:recombinase family protein [Defluviitaleaceae bacterium]